MSAGAGARTNATDVNLRIGQWVITADSATFGATETQLATLAVNVVSGQKYKLTFSAGVGVDVAADCPVIRVHEDTSAGTQILVGQCYGDTTSGVGFMLTYVVDWTAAATGSKTFVITGQRNDGTGTAHRIRAASSRPATLIVEKVQ